MKKITILGSTGSIGTNALKIIDSNPADYRVVALAAGKNVELLVTQIKNYHPAVAAISGKALADAVRDRIRGYSETEVLSGPEGYAQVAGFEEADTVISAITGAAGLMPTYSAIKAGKKIALANKETMVMAGSFVMALAREKNVSILPIDSEHSAVFQALQGHRREDLRKIILTASGGPFRDYSLSEMKALKPASALKHPNWSMGKKISIDSATLMNKGLEAIEARWFFNVAMEQIDILVHPESIIHSMVEYMDGSVIAQMGIPDMITPISYSLSYPRHQETNLPPLKLEDIGTLSFRKPDLERFKCLALALDASKIGESMPVVLNGANEVAVESFLKGRIGFLQIPVVIEKTMAKHKVLTIDAMEGVLDADKWARRTAENELRRLEN